LINFYWHVKNTKPDQVDDIIEKAVRAHRRGLTIHDIIIQRDLDHYGDPIFRINVIYRDGQEIKPARHFSLMLGIRDGLKRLMNMVFHWCGH
jgi:hypothetical protein